MTNDELEPEYCPVCGRWIPPQEDDDGRTCYVHDNIIHTDSDIQALKYGIN